jgi:glycine/sarcosine N-methyltransferase
MTEPNEFSNASGELLEDFRWRFRDWDAELEREGLNLRRLLRENGATTVVDASCGPGTQSIALARLGFNVIAADPNADMLELAERNANDHRVRERITFVQSEFRDLLRHVQKPVDAVITKGNVISYLQYDAQIEEALLVFYELLSPGGMLLIGMRDYEPLLEDRPRFWPGRVHDEPEEQVITFEIWDWEDGPPVTVKMSRFVVRGNGNGYRVTQRPVVVRALTVDEVAVALSEVGFDEFQYRRDRWEVLITATRPK